MSEYLNMANLPKRPSKLLEFLSLLLTTTSLLLVASLAETSKFDAIEESAPSDDSTSDTIRGTAASNLDGGSKRFAGTTYPVDIFKSKTAVVVSVIGTTPQMRSYPEEESSTLSVPEPPISDVSTVLPSTTTTPKDAQSRSPEIGKRKKTGRNRARPASGGKKSSLKNVTTDSSKSLSSTGSDINPEATTENERSIPSNGQLNDNPWFHGNRDDAAFSFGRGGTVKDEEKQKSIKKFQNPKVEPFGPALGSPDWEVGKKEWGVAWPIHIYLAGTAFVVLVVFGCFNLLRVKTSTKLLGIGYYVTLNLFIIFIGLLRSVYLLFDSYNSEGRFPATIHFCLYDLVHPCLSAALAVLFLAIFKETKVDLLPHCLRRPGTLAAMSVIHFALTLTMDVVAGLAMDEKSFFMAGTFILISETVFVVWTLVLILVYFAAFKRSLKAALRKQGEMIRVTFTKLHIDGAQLPKKLPRPTLALSVKLTLVAALLASGLALARVYGVAFNNGIPSATIKVLEPWPWWWYHLTSRVIEMLLCSVVLFVSSQPLRDFECREDSENVSESWVPRRLSRSFSCNCCRKRLEDVDLDDSYDTYFNNHLVHYNNRGFRNSGFSHSLEGHHRRWDNHHTNSLPPFNRTNPPKGPEGGAPSSSTEASHDHPSMPVSRLAMGSNNGGLKQILSNATSHQIITSTGRSNRSVVKNMAECGNQGSTTIIPPVVPPHGTLQSDGSRTNSSGRPSSMLFKDNGFIRFRREDDPEQPMELSDETTEEDGCSAKDGDSVVAEAGSGAHSLCEADFVQSTLSPFFQHFGHHQHQHHHHHHTGPPRVKLFSRCSLDTLDNSGGDASSEQLSNVTSKNGLSNGALDCQSKRHGSTCSSESAANSFDVTFYLQGLSRQSTPAIRSVSPMTSRACRRFHGVPTNLDLGKETSGRSSRYSDVGVVNVACGTEDVTPDSAVFMDLHLTEEVDPGVINPIICESQPVRRNKTMFSRGTDMVSEEPTQPWSHSLNDLTGYDALRGWKVSKAWLNRLKGSSSFSLNGYELLPAVDADLSDKRGWVRRASSDRWKRPAHKATSRTFLSLSDVAKADYIFPAEMVQGDSGLLGDSQEPQVDKSAQTDDFLLISPYTRFEKCSDENITAFNLIEENYSLENA